MQDVRITAISENLHDIFNCWMGSSNARLLMDNTMRALKTSKTSNLQVLWTCINKFGELMEQESIGRQEAESRLAACQSELATCRDAITMYMGELSVVKTASNVALEKVQILQTAAQAHLDRFEKALMSMDNANLASTDAASSSTSPEVDTTAASSILQEAKAQLRRRLPAALPHQAPSALTPSEVAPNVTSAPSQQQGDAEEHKVQFADPRDDASNNNPSSASGSGDAKTLIDFGHSALATCRDSMAITKVAMGVIVVALAVLIAGDVKKWDEWMNLLNLAVTAAMGVRTLWKDGYKAVHGRDRY